MSVRARFMPVPEAENDVGSPTGRYFVQRCIWDEAAGAWFVELESTADSCGPYALRAAKARATILNREAR